MGSGDEPAPFPNGWSGRNGENVFDRWKAGELRIALVANRDAGANLTGGWERLSHALNDALTRHGVVVHTLRASGREISDSLSSIARRDDIDLLVVAGGDGTVSSSARQCSEAGKWLLPLPFGTYNLICRSIGFPNNAQGAIAAIDALEPSDVDVGTINGEAFLHHVTAGLHARFVALRDAVPHQSRTGKILASGLATWRLLRMLPRRSLRILTDSEQREGRVAGLAITVNAISIEPDLAAVIADPQGQRLWVYATGASKPAQVLTLLLRAILGLDVRDTQLDVMSGKTVVVEGKSKRVKVALDGEPRTLELPLRCSVEAGALRVLRPRPSD